jgi:hypothetical protein
VLCCACCVVLLVVQSYNWHEPNVRRRVWRLKNANIHVTHDHNCVARRQLGALSYYQCILHAWCLGLLQALTSFSLHLRPCSGAGASLGIHGVPFQQMMRSIYERFVDEKVEACVQRCREDLFGMTRYGSGFYVRLCSGS